MEVQGVTLAYRRLCVIIRRLGYSLLTSVARATSAMTGSRMLAVATLEVTSVRAAMMMQITTTIAQVGRLSRP